RPRGTHRRLDRRDGPRRTVAPSRRRAVDRPGRSHCRRARRGRRCTPLHCRVVATGCAAIPRPANCLRAMSRADQPHGAPPPMDTIAPIAVGDTEQMNTREPDAVTIRGAREHNLKNVTVEIPKKKLVVLTGVSGSGKSSLAFDTLYAEGQRRYVESL